MRIRKVHHEATPGKVNVTPLIDVVMCLIVFYLIVTTLASDRLAGLSLPETSRGAAEIETALLVVNIAPGAAPGSARYLIDNREVPRESLPQVVRESVPDAAAATEATVQIRADRSLPYSAIAPVVEACRAAGLTTIKLVSERADGVTTGGSPR